MRSARGTRARKRTKQGAKIRILVPLKKGDLGGFTHLNPAIGVSKHPLSTQTRFLFEEVGFVAIWIGWLFCTIHKKDPTIDLDRGVNY
jgi:hypothetical protein